MSDRSLRLCVPLLAIAFAAGAILVPPSPRAQSAAADLPPGVYKGVPDYKQAAAGSYALDPDHASVIARVSHIGYSYSIFRFDRLGATLKWDPDNPASGSLAARVETASITSNVKGFGEQLAGDEFLKAKAFPEATFVSTVFRQSGPLAGRIEGQLTLMGKTRPLTFDVELVGAGKGFAGQPRIGATARGRIKPVEFGLSPLLGETIEIVIDGEFQRTP